MRFISLFFIFIFLTACSTRPNAPLSHDMNTKSKILANQSEAISAKDEYKKLQEERKKV